MDEKSERRKRDAAAAAMAAPGVTAARAGTMEQRATEAAALAEEARRGMPWPLDQYVGEALYFDGVRMSWYGRLLGVTAIYGEAALLLHPMVRVGDFNDEGPVWNFCEAWVTTPDRPGILFLRDVSAINLPHEGWQLPDDPSTLPGQGRRRGGAQRAEDA